MKDYETIWDRDFRAIVAGLAACAANTAEDAKYFISTAEDWADEMQRIRRRREED